MKTYKRYGLLLFLASLLFVGCVPLWVHDYYRPEAPGGNIKKSMCRGASGPPDTIEFLRDEVAIRVKAGRVENGIHLYLEIQIPKGREARLVTTAIHVSSPSSPQAFEGILAPIIYTDDTRWKIDEPLTGETIESPAVFGPRYYGKYFAMETTIAMPKSDTIRVWLPEIYINGQKISLPDISFTKDTSTELFMPVNC